MTILIIEDSYDVRENLGEMLELENYFVIKAENGKKGIEMAETYKPDVIVCDIVMPGLNGYEVVAQLRKNWITSNIPIVFLTAKSEKVDVQIGIQLGAMDYLVKPIGCADLLTVIKKYTRCDNLV